MGGVKIIYQNLIVSFRLYTPFLPTFLFYNKVGIHPSVFKRQCCGWHKCVSDILDKNNIAHSHAKTKGN